jgi:hypothetical protein
MDKPDDASAHVTPDLPPRVDTPDLAGQGGPRPGDAGSAPGGPRARRAGSGTRRRPGNRSRGQGSPPERK